MVNWFGPLEVIGGLGTTQCLYLKALTSLLVSLSPLTSMLSATALMLLPNSGQLVFHHKKEEGAQYAYVRMPFPSMAYYEPTYRTLRALAIL